MAKINFFSISFRCRGNLNGSVCTSSIALRLDFKNEENEVVTEKAINPGAVFPSLSRLTTDTFSIKIPLNDASKRRWNDIIADNA